MKPHRGVLFIFTFLTTVQLAFASLHQYIVCPTKSYYTSGTYDNTVYPSNDPATNFRAALIKCDHDEAACVGVDAFGGNIEIYHSVQATYGLSVGTSEGLALRE